MRGVELRKPAPGAAKNGRPQMRYWSKYQPIQGKAIIEKLDLLYGDESASIEVSTLTSRIIPNLKKKRGIDSIKGAGGGYYDPKTLKP